MVRYLTTNGKSDTYGLSHPFALRYRRVNGTFYEIINFDALAKSRKSLFSVIPAKAGIQCFFRLRKSLDPVFQRGDDFTSSSIFVLSWLPWFLWLFILGILGTLAHFRHSFFGLRTTDHGQPATRYLQRATGNQPRPWILGGAPDFLVAK